VVKLLTLYTDPYRRRDDIMMPLTDRILRTIKCKNWRVDSVWV